MSNSGRILNFYSKIDVPKYLPNDVEVIFPFKEKVQMKLINEFYKKFYSDDEPRVFVLGINPGRFGSGVTGIPFTGSIELDIFCNIENNLPKKLERTSKFIYDVINKFGGPEKFYKKFFLTAVSPIGFLKDGKNYNYYDSKEMLKITEDFISESLSRQLESVKHKNDMAIILGKGKNHFFFNKINQRYNFFRNIKVLEHPRYIMQYKNRELSSYTEKYIRLLSGMV